MRELIIKIESMILKGSISNLEGEKILNRNGIEVEWTDDPNVTIYRWEGGEYTSVI